MPEKPKHVIEMITPAFLNKYPSSDFEFQAVCHNVNQFSLTLFCLFVSQRAGSPWKCDICPLVRRANKPSTFRCRLKTFTVIFCVQAALVFLRRSLVKLKQPPGIPGPSFSSLTRSSMSVSRSAVLTDIKVE